MEHPHRNVAIYCRTAHCDEWALENQVERLRRFAEELSMGEFAVYMDNGYSGLNFDRPGLSRLEADILAGRIQAVVALDQSRIGRDYLLASDWLQRMRDMGVRFVFQLHPDNDVQALIRNSLADAWKMKKARTGWV